MDALIVYLKDKEYPEQVLNEVQESLKQAEEGQLTPYKGLRDMLL